MKPLLNYALLALLLISAISVAFTAFVFSSGPLPRQAPTYPPSNQVTATPEKQTQSWPPSPPPLASVRPRIPTYLQTNQDVATGETPFPFPTTITRFSTADTPDRVYQFYSQGLTQAGWHVGLLPLASIKPLPTLPSEDSQLVHGNYVEGCPLYFVDVIIQPLGATCSYVTVTDGVVGCY